MWLGRGAPVLWRSELRCGRGGRRHPGALLKRGTAGFRLPFRMAMKPKTQKPGLYDFASIERRWQQYWEEHATFASLNRTSRRSQMNASIPDGQESASRGFPFESDFSHTVRRQSERETRLKQRPHFTVVVKVAFADFSDLVTPVLD